MKRQSELKSEDGSIEFPLVTIVIPVFNSQDYLRNCIESAVKQSYSNIEILIVNDGSSDNSLRIIDEFAADHRNITCFSQENHGVGAARNKGIRHARGKYIQFLDSDDILDVTAIATMVTLCEKHSLDMVMFDARVLIDEQYGGGRMRNVSYRRLHEYLEIMSGYGMLTALLKNREYFSSSCLFLTKIEFLKRTSVLFPEGIIHEDEAFTFLLMLYAEKIMHINDQVYIRRIRQGSVMTSMSKAKSFVGYKKVAISLCQARETIPDAHQAILNRRIGTILEKACFIYHGMPRGDRLEYANEYKKVKRFARGNSYFGLKYGWLIFNGFDIYKKLETIKKSVLGNINRK